MGVEPKFRVSKNESESIIRQAPDVADTPTEALNALNRSLLQGGDESELTYVEFPLAQVIGTLSHQLHKYFLLKGSLKIFVRILVSTRACHWVIIAHLMRESWVQFPDKELSSILKRMFLN